MDVGRTAFVRLFRCVYFVVSSLDITKFLFVKSIPFYFASYIVSNPI